MAPWVRRTWSPRGQTPILRQRTRSHKKVSIIAALCLAPQRDRIQLYFRLHPDANIRAVNIVDFLRQLHKQLQAPFVLLWDRLQAHRARKVQTFMANRPNICPFFFPPYAPELNPVEYVWGYLKTNPLANLALTDINALVTVTRHHSRSLQHKPELLRSFIKHSPLFLRLK